MLEEAALLFDQLPEGHSFWKSFLEQFGRTLVVGVPLAIYAQQVHEEQVDIGTSSARPKSAVASSRSWA